MTACDTCGTSYSLLYGTWAIERDRTSGGNGGMYNLTGHIPFLRSTG